ncbi:MAG: ATP-dependent helicase, partial [Hydrogenophaga sp.]|nr:ATP-dependent helicase [Hydrogenophaga sp.]
IGKKFELEALELEADRRPAGHFNDGQRAWRQGGTPEDDGQGDIRAARSSREGRAEREDRRPARAPRPPADPLFDKPYEPSTASDARPAWEQQAQQRPSSRVGSPNIKTRKKVAALFKPVAPEEESQPQTQAG